MRPKTFLVSSLIFMCFSLFCSTNAQESKVFPAIRLTSLTGQTIVIPTQSSKGKTAVIVAFDHRLQPEINSWLTWFQSVENQYPSLRDFYELPVVDSKYISARGPILHFMKKKLPSPIYQSRTLPVFAKKQAFSKQLGANTALVTLFLLDAQGQIVLKIEGNLSPEKKQQILNQLM